MNKNDTEIRIDDNFDFDFKPIHEGMGFHKEEKPMARPGKGLKVSQKFKPNVEISQRGLESIYGKNEEASLSTQKQAQTNHEATWLTYSNPRSYQQTIAYMVDLLAVGAFVSLTWLSFSLSLFHLFAIDLQSVFYSFPLIEKIAFGASFFALFYLIYFCLFDLFSSTLGKSLFGMRVLTVKKKKPSVGQVFLRSLVTLSSCVVFFFPLFIRFQDRISETIVLIEKKEKRKKSSLKASREQGSLFSSLSTQKKPLQ